MCFICKKLITNQDQETLLAAAIELFECKVIDIEHYAEVLDKIAGTEHD